MIITKSKPEQVDFIMHLYDEATAYQASVNAPKIWKGFDPEIVHEAIAEDRQWQIVEGGEIACVFTLTFEDALIWKEKNNDPAIYIHRIATNPKFRGKGYVKYIVEWAKNYAGSLGKKYVRMDTGSGNEKLNQYYYKCGFEYKGITNMGAAEGLPAHYKNGSFTLFEIEL